PVLCLLARRPGGLSLRKLAPTQVILVNGQTATRAELGDGDRLTLGAMDVFVHVKNVVREPASPAAAPESARGERATKLEAAGSSTGGEEELARKLNAVDAQAVDLDKQRQELATMRQE